MRRVLAVLFGTHLMAAGAVFAQGIPAPADAGRVPRSFQMHPPQFAPEEETIKIPTITPTTQIPPASRGVRFRLRDVRIEGATALSRTELKGLYGQQLGKELPLETIWQLAGAITERYHSRGFFLSRAYVPEQAIDNGVVVIKVVEGYIGKVKFDHPLAKRFVVRKMLDELRRRKPITSDGLEEFLLKLNDLPGASFRAVLLQMDEPGVEEGAVMLAIETSKKQHRGSVTYDNAGSRFLGPNEISANYQASFLPLQQTTIGVLSSLPADEMKYVSVSHMAAVAPNVTAQLRADMAVIRPGYTLKNLDVKSRSTGLGVDMSYQLLRKRRENLAVTAGISGRNTDGELLGATTTKDRVRSVHIGTLYDIFDRWLGYNVVNTEIKQGLPWLGASEKGEANLSRAEATPDFTKVEASASRLQEINKDWYLYAAASGQIASGPLYSAEEFGYGGKAFGRAYDSSEITGDHGIAGSVEARYAHWNTLEPVGLTPYAFYDAGMVWNDDTGAPDSAFGNSAGLGVRFLIQPYAVTGDLSVAVPLSRPTSTTLYGTSTKGPRIGLEFSKEF